MWTEGGTTINEHGEDEFFSGNVWAGLEFYGFVGKTDSNEAVATESNTLPAIRIPGSCLTDIEGVDNA